MMVSDRHDVRKIFSHRWFGLLVLSEGSKTSKVSATSWIALQAASTKGHALRCCEYTPLFDST